MGTCQRHRFAQMLASSLQDRRGEAGALLELGRTYRKQGRWQQAGAHQELSLAIFRLLGDRRGEGRALNGLGLIYDYLGRSQEAAASYERALGVARKLGDRLREAEALAGLGRLDAGRRPSGETGVATAIGRRKDPSQVETQ